MQAPALSAARLTSASELAPVQGCVTLTWLLPGVHDLATFGSCSASSACNLLQVFCILFALFLFQDFKPVHCNVLLFPHSVHTVYIWGHGASLI